MGMLIMTLKVMVEPNQLMLIAISMFMGLQLGFVSADYTAVLTYLFGSKVIGTEKIIRHSSLELASM